MVQATGKLVGVPRPVHQIARIGEFTRITKLCFESPSPVTAMYLKASAKRAVEIAVKVDRILAQPINNPEDR